MGMPIEVQILETLQTIEQHLSHLVEREKFKDKVYAESQRKVVLPKENLSPLEQGPELMVSKHKSRLTYKDILFILLCMILVSAALYPITQEVILQFF